MQLYLLRHGIAEEARLNQSDADRALTPEGRKKLRHVLQMATKTGMKPTLMLSSPYKRAMQTADIAKRILKYEGDIVQTNLLIPSSTAEHVWEEIRVRRTKPSLLLAGHNPLFEHLAGYLLGYSDLKMDFKKGALLRIDIDSFGAQPKGILRWCLTAKLAENGD